MGNKSVWGQGSGNGVAVESTPESLAAGVDTQLEKALEAVQTL